MKATQGRDRGDETSGDGALEPPNLTEEGLLQGIQAYTEGLRLVRNEIRRLNRRKVSRISAALIADNIITRNVIPPDVGLSRAALVDLAVDALRQRYGL